MTMASKSSTTRAAQGELGEVSAAAPIARLTDPAVARELNREIKAMKSDPSLARNFLVELGLITPKTGKLTRRFGG